MTSDLIQSAELIKAMNHRGRQRIDYFLHFINMRPIGQEKKKYWITEKVDGIENQTLISHSSGRGGLRKGLRRDSGRSLLGKKQNEWGIGRELMVKSVIDRLKATESKQKEKTNEINGKL